MVQPRECDWLQLVAEKCRHSKIICFPGRHIFRHKSRRRCLSDFPLLLKIIWKNRQKKVFRFPNSRPHSLARSRFAKCPSHSDPRLMSISKIQRLLKFPTFPDIPARTDRVCCFCTNTTLGRPAGETNIVYSVARSTGNSLEWLKFTK